jgi:hypothetical protein
MSHILTHRLGVCVSLLCSSTRSWFRLYIELNSYLHAPTDLFYDKKPTSCEYETVWTPESFRTWWLRENSVTLSVFKIPSEVV